MGPFRTAYYIRIGSVRNIGFHRHLQMDMDSHSRGFYSGHVCNGMP